MALPISAASFGPPVILTVSTTCSPGLMPEKTLSFLQAICSHAMIVEMQLKGFRSSTISALASRNLMDAFLRYGRPKRFVNVSSFAVYSTLSLKRGDLLDETCPLEDSPQKRFDAYGFGKLKQEELVKEYGRKSKLPYVIVRPGYVFGPGKRELNSRVGIGSFGLLIQIGGSNPLPLTFLDN